MLNQGKDFGMDEASFAEVERLVSLEDPDVRGRMGKIQAELGRLAFEKLFSEYAAVDREDAREFATSMFTRVAELKLQVEDLAALKGQADAKLKMVLDRESATTERHDARAEAGCFCGGALAGAGSIHSCGMCSSDPVEESEESWQAAEAMHRPKGGHEQD